MAKKKKSSDAEPPNPLGWMVTFSDLITLLLTFFVLLISMSSMDIRAMKQSFGMIFEGGSGVLDFPEAGQMQQLISVIESMEEIPATILLDQETLQDMVFDFQDAQFQNLMALVDQDISVFQDERGLVIQLTDYILFDEGGAQLKREFLPLLSKVANVLRNTPYPISIEGHTGSTALEGGMEEAWAWDLSLERAIAVKDFFTGEEGLPEERFRVGGFGASQPVYPNTTPANQARNRRIEIVLYKETF